MSLFRRLSRKAREAINRRDDIYDPYTQSESKDNPYLTNYGTGFAYKTLEYALLSTWMLVNDFDAYIPDTLENIVLGLDAKISDDDAHVDSFRGYVFELARLIKVTLAPDTDAYSLALLTSEKDTEVTESMSYSARAFIAASIEGDTDNAVQIGRTVCEMSADSEDEIFDTYIMFIVTVLTLVVREWFFQAFPEFDCTEIEGGESVNADE